MAYFSVYFFQLEDHSMNVSLVSQQMKHDGSDERRILKTPQNSSQITAGPSCFPPSSWNDTCQSPIRQMLCSDTTMRLDEKQETGSNRYQGQRPGHKANLASSCFLLTLNQCVHTHACTRIHFLYIMSLFLHVDCFYFGPSSRWYLAPLLVCSSPSYNEICSCVISLPSGPLTFPH